MENTKTIVSAISLWKKYDLSNPLGESEWGIENTDGMRRSNVSYYGHKVEDGSVRIYARFCRPEGDGKRPTVLFLGDAGEPVSEDILTYFVQKGYAALAPDYSGKTAADGEDALRTAYPPSLEYGNLEKAQGLNGLKDLETDKTSWFEWTYVALYSIEYLKKREDVGAIGVVGVRKGGEIAWQVMLSPDVKCGVPISAAGWRSFSKIAKFGDDIAHNLSDDRHRYIAAIEAQSYAPYVKCPVLMLGTLHDKTFDCDRAYDTYSRIGNGGGNALAYSMESGGCIGPNGLADMDLFLEKNLKGREIYVPDTLNVSLKETEEGLLVEVECDKEGILEESGIFYAEADVGTKSAYREWRCQYKVDGISVKNGRYSYTISPFAGASAAFVFAYAKYINGFRVMSKIVSRRFAKPDFNAIRNRDVFTDGNLECFSIANHADYSIGGIFLERFAVPKHFKGYGGIEGAYSIGGIRTYKISSPRFVPPDNALLAFDVYSPQTQDIVVTIETAQVEKGDGSYVCVVPVKGGGKWKRIILKAADFKGGEYGYSLENFADGSALVFACANEEREFAVTNILWL